MVNTCTSHPLSRLVYTFDGRTRLVKNGPLNDPILDSIVLPQLKYYFPSLNYFAKKAVMHAYLAKNAKVDDGPKAKMKNIKVACGFMYKDFVVSLKQKH